MSIVERRDDDLFAGSTMSFGDHLEELRTRLFRAVAGLAVGCLVGLAVGSYVVEVIKLPLENGLATYYREGAVVDYKKFLADQAAAGLPAPYTLAQVEHLVNKQHLIYTTYRVHPTAVRATLGLSTPTDKAASAAPPGTSAAAPPSKPATPPDSAAASAAAVATEPLTPLFVWRPMTEDERVYVKGFSAQEPFMIWLKASMMAGIVLSSPWVFYQLWGFVAAGLYPNERRYVHVFLPASIGLFLTGALFCFFIVFKFIIDYFFSWNRSLGITPEPRINEWLGFAIFLPVGFGLSFQLPLVMLFLNRIRLFSIADYLAKWRIAVMVIFIVAMFVTPSDPISMPLMAVPLVGLYFGGILLCKWFPTPKGPLEA